MARLLREAAIFVSFLKEVTNHQRQGHSPAFLIGMGKKRDVGKKRDGHEKMHF